MFEEKHIPNRQVGEKLITFLRPHIIYLLGIIFFFIFQISIPILLYIFLNNSFSSLFNNDIFVILFVLLFTLYLLLAYLIFYNNFIDYHLDVWVVTNRRIIAIVQHNIFNRTIKEYPIERIQDVSSNQKGIWQTFFEYGDVTIQTASEDDPIVFDNVPHPFKVAQIVSALLEKQLKK